MAKLEQKTNNGFVEWALSWHLREGESEEIKWTSTTHCIAVQAAFGCHAYVIPCHSRYDKRCLHYSTKPARNLPFVSAATLHWKWSWWWQTQDHEQGSNVICVRVSKNAYYTVGVLTRILPSFGIHSDSTFSGIRWDSFSILVPILAFPGTRLDSTIFRYSHRLDPFQIGRASCRERV